MSPRLRLATLPLLLMARPYSLDELRDRLDVDASTLRRDLAILREAGWEVEEQGGGPHQPKSVWIPRC